MNRIALLLISLALVGGSLMVALADSDDDGRRRKGKGYGHGRMGYGMMGPGMGHGPGMQKFLDKLPQEKRAELDRIHESMRESMRAKRQEMKALRDDLHAALQAYPIDRAAAKKSWQALNRYRAEMFDMHLNLMAESQSALGEKLWEQLKRERKEMWSKHRRGKRSGKGREAHRGRRGKRDRDDDD